MRSRPWPQGVTLLTGCRAEGLVMRDGAVRGVRVAGVDDIIEAPLVIACDGTLSLLAKEAGLHKGFKAEQVALGVRALYALERGGDQRPLRPRPAGRAPRRSSWAAPKACAEAASSTRRPRRCRWAWWCIWTRSRSGGIPPYELLERFVASPPVAPLLRGARLVEYSAHLLPEAGMRMVPGSPPRACWSPATPPASATPTA